MSSGAAGGAGGAGRGGKALSQGTDFVAVTAARLHVSALLPFPAGDAWHALRTLRFDALLPGSVEASELLDRSDTAVGGRRLITWRDGAAWTVAVTALSDDARTVAWSVTSAEPALGYSSRRDEVQIRDVSVADHPTCFIEWTVDFSADVSALAVEDCRLKLGDYLSELKVSLRGLPGRKFVMPELRSDEVALYFGTHKVQFSAVDGDTDAFTPGCLKENLNTESTRVTSLARMSDCSALGEEYASVYQPCIPAADPVADFKADAVADLPEVLRKPLVKTADGPIEGIRSGGRSAIIMLGKTAYRLKGCGNYVDGEYAGKTLRFPFPGMPVAPMEKIDWSTFMEVPGAREVRGVAFPHTVDRELLMAGVVDEAMRAINIPCALLPVAKWTYGFEGEPLPKLKKSCGVFRTLGERRAASHLFTGLELLLPLLFPEVSAETILAVFECRGRGGPYTEAIFDPTSGSKTGDVVHDVVPTHAVASAKKAYIDFLECLPDCDVGAPATERGCPVNEEVFGLLWKEAIAQLVASCESAGVSVFAAVLHAMWRAGREAGAIVKAMADAELSWGYYVDHVMEPHCNAHPNNLAVLPPSADGRGALLGPLDFDMAYPRSSYYHNVSGQIDDPDFLANLRSETSAMRSNIAGSTDSTGLADMATDVPPAHTLLKYALRDAGVLAFDIARAGRLDPHPLGADLDVATHCVARLALVLASSRHS